jgi:hypothetical protein
MTPTEKKYAKHLGNLYWMLDRNYDNTQQTYINYYNLVIINGLYRRYGSSGRYQFHYDILKYGYPYTAEEVESMRRTFKYPAGEFIDGITNHTMWTKIIPTDGETLPDDANKKFDYDAYMRGQVTP